MAAGRTEVAEAGSAIGAGSVFLSRDFRLYQTARLLVILGAEAQSIAVAWQVYQITHHPPLYLGLTGLTIFAPAFFFMLAAGHVADRYDRRAVILACYSLQALCTLALHALCPASQRPRLAHLRCALRRWVWDAPSAVRLPRPFCPAWYPATTSSMRSPGAPSSSRSPTSPGLRWAACSSPCACTGSLARWNGGAAVYAFTLMTLLAFLVLVGMMRTRPVRMVKNAFNLETMLAGFKYVWQTKLLLGSISLDFFAVFLGGATALLPIFAVDILHGGPRALGLLRAMPCPRRHDGLALDDGEANPAQCGQANAHLRRNLRRGNGGLRPLPHHVAQPACPGTVGASDMVSVVIRASILQLATPSWLRGRVSAVNGFFVGASNEFGGYESGQSPRSGGARSRAVVVGGIGALIVTGLASTLFPALHKADALTTESLMQANLQNSISGPLD